MYVDLRALQLQVEAENSVEYTRNTLTDAVNFLSSYKDNKNNVELILKELRDGFDVSNIKEEGIFFYDNDIIDSLDIEDRFKSYSLGLFSNNHYCKYSGRLVYPVRDVTGKVMGLCGWDKFEEPKYLDSVSYGYNAKRNIMYGMECIEEYYNSKDNIFIVEGIPCCNYLRSKGFKSLALLSSNISKYVVEILKRFGDRCIFLMDNDKAGLNVLKVSSKSIPKSRCYVSIIAKDIDDTRRINEKDLIKELNSMNNLFSTNKVLKIVTIVKKFI